MTPAACALALAGAIFVIDADTVEQDRVRYRLVGLDAPEITAARCREERQAGIRSAARLLELMAARGAELVSLGRREKFGRTLARLTIGGEDWATIAIREGHAVAYHGRGPRPSWCPPAS